jgi:hypothetical protein
MRRFPFSGVCSVLRATQAFQGLKLIFLQLRHCRRQQPSHGSIFAGKVNIISEIRSEINLIYELWSSLWPLDESRGSPDALRPRFRRHDNHAPSTDCTRYGRSKAAITTPGKRFLPAKALRAVAEAASWRLPTFVQRLLARSAQFPISDLALSGVIASVGTVTVVGTVSAQSSRIALAISIASGPPVG